MFVKVSLNPEKEYQTTVQYGRKDKVSAQYKKMAEDYIRGYAKMTPKMQTVLSLVAVTGITTYLQLSRLTNVSLRTIQYYHQKYLLDLVSPPKELLDLKMISQELDGEKVFQEDIRFHKLIMLGPVALEWFQMKYGDKPTMPNPLHTVHNILANEIAVALNVKARSLGYTDTALYNPVPLLDENQKVLVIPDAIIGMEKDGRQQTFVLEFHNEDTGRRTEEKLKAYEKVFRLNRWQETWQTETFPKVLIVYHKDAISSGYMGAMERMKGHGVRCDYYMKPLRNIMQGKCDLWYSLFNEEKVNLFTGEVIL